MAGAPVGNRNAVKNKLWSDTLRRAITQDSGDRVRRAAERLLDSAAQGEQWAIKELADRLDGKPAQSAALGLFGENQEARIVVNWAIPESSIQG
jgi:hypothetical protein